MAKRIFTAEDVEHMRYLYEEEGRDSCEIAERMHCFHTTVRKYLREAGVQIRPKGGSQPLKGVTHQEMDLIRFLYFRREWTIEMIADSMGVKEYTIRRRMRMGGIPRRDSSTALRVAHKHGRARSPKHIIRERGQEMITA